jgi:hypothetical protein
MGELVTVLNAAGGAFVAFAAQMLIQSSVLIVLLAVLDFVLRRRIVHPITTRRRNRCLLRTPGP